MKYSPLPYLGRHLLTREFSQSVDSDYRVKLTKNSTVEKYLHGDLESVYDVTSPETITYSKYNPAKPGIDKSGHFVRATIQEEISKLPISTQTKFDASIKKFWRSPYDENFDKELLSKYPGFDKRQYFHNLRPRERHKWEKIIDTVTAAIKADFPNPLTKWSTGKVLASDDFEKSTASDLFYRARAKHTNNLQLLQELRHTSHPEWYPEFVEPQRHGNRYYLKNKSQTISMFYRLIKDRNKNFKELTLPPSRVAHRLQVCNIPKVKCRMITVAPLDVVIEEMGYVLPFMEAQRNVDSTLFMFKSFIEGRMYREIQSQIDFKQGIAYSMDWTNFDASIPTFMLQMAFSIFFSLYDNQIRSNGDVIWPQSDLAKSKARLEHLLMYYFNTPYQLPSNHSVYIKHGGIPSGVGMTNILGGIINALCIAYLCRYEANQWPIWLKVQGDDSYTLVARQLDLSKFESTAKHKWGMILNQNKTSCSLDGPVSILGHEISAKYVSREPGKNLVSAMQPEKPSQTHFRALERLVGLMWTFHLADEHFVTLLHLFANLIDKFVQEFLPDLALSELKIRPSAMRYIPKHTWKHIGDLTPSIDRIIEMKSRLSRTGSLGTPFARIVNGF